MTKKDKNIQLRSDEVQEIMSQIPNWMVRWGITLIFVLISLGIFITWFIKYPDIIDGSAILSTEQPTIMLIAKNSGEINTLNVSDQQFVQKGDVIATLENDLDLEAKTYLERLCVTLRSELKSDQILMEFNDDYLIFGAIQANYTQLKTDVLNYHSFQENNTQAFDIKNINEQLQNYYALRAVTNEQVANSKEQLGRAKDKFESDKRLYESGVISKNQFYEEEKAVSIIQNELSNQKKSIVLNSITIADLKKQLNQLNADYNEQLNGFRNSMERSLKIIENAVENWKRKFEIKALIDGKLLYLTNLAENQFIKSGFTPFAIIPNNQKHVGYITIPQQGYGKIKIGQKVRVKLDNYPYHEYGQLNGLVTSISLIPSKKQYKVEFALSDGLRSSYGKILEYTPEMSGTAEIITEDLRLMERIFNNFRQIFD